MADDVHKFFIGEHELTATVEPGPQEGKYFAHTDCPLGNCEASRITSNGFAPSAAEAVDRLSARVRTHFDAIHGITYPAPSGEGVNDE